jgi:DNA-binding MarR family transcriptional regulator
MANELCGQNGDRVTGDDAAYRLQIAVTRLARLLRQEVQAELTPSQISVLSTIRRCGPITLGELAERERVAPPSITRMVDRLAEDGFVERMADPGDRRVCRVVTTQLAEEMVVEARTRKAEWIEARMADLGAADRRRLVAAVDAIEHLADLP